MRPLEGDDNPGSVTLHMSFRPAHSIATKQLDFGPFNKSFDFVPNDWNEQKLIIKYSLKVRQYSLGPEGYKYWNEMGHSARGRAPCLTDNRPC